MEDYCIWKICFFPLDGQGDKIFGFAEYIASLALMVLAWTIADIRYRFRIETAPLPVKNITFVVVAAVGFFTLATDLWRAEQWYVPRGNLISSSMWQALLGAAFLCTFLMWSWFAFIRPQRFGRANARRFAHAVYRRILKGDNHEISVIADEIAMSARQLVIAAPLLVPRWGDDPEPPNALQLHAQDILLLMGDKRFAKAVVRSSPGTLLALFWAIEDTKRYRIPLQTFVRNVMNEALLDPDSFIYHEEEGYVSGLMGYHKPLTQAMFANYNLVEAFETALDPNFSRTQSWSAPHWEAYGRITLLTLGGFIRTRHVSNHSFVLYRAFYNIARSCLDLHQLNGMDGPTFQDDRQARLRTAVRTLIRAMEALNATDHREVSLRLRSEKYQNESIYDLIADCMVEVIKEAALVKGPRMTAWYIQHNAVWGELFAFAGSREGAARVIMFKIRRKLYDEVKQLERMTNYQSAAVLGLMLNVMRFTADKRYYRDGQPLHRAILRWTKQNYLKIHRSNQKLAEACLVDGMELDEENNRLVRARGIRPTEKPIYEYLSLNPLSDDTEHERS